MRFISIDSRLKVLVDPGKQDIDKWGNISVISPTFVQFRNGVVEVKDDDEQAIARLRGLDSFGLRIFEGVAPDDVVLTQTVAQKYVCGFPKCKYETFSKDDMSSHKQDTHSKAARLRIKRERMKPLPRKEEEEE